MFDFPLELFYGGPRPNPSAPICEVWPTQQLPDGRCPACAIAPGSASAYSPTIGSICLSHFWATRMVVDRRTGRRPSIRTATAGRLRPLTSTIVAASANIEPSELSSLQLAAKEKLGPAIAAIDWQDWRLGTAAAHPLLIALAEHRTAAPQNDDQQSATAAILGTTVLEIGGDTVAFNDIDADFVGKRKGEPGPLIVLAPPNGPGAATPNNAYAALMTQAGAAYVFATIGRVLPHRAADVAEAIIDAATRVDPQNAYGTVGHVLLTSRRALLARGIAAGFALIGYGDSEWGLPIDGSAEPPAQARQAGMSTAFNV